ncbi:hypothetical protein [Bacillus siamensis]|uniref:hypothetical protein n=1 Tax=Bacillus siamensis TaxID=659243 RepID=UPI003F6631CD
MKKSVTKGIIMSTVASVSIFSLVPLAGAVSTTKEVQNNQTIQSQYQNQAVLHKSAQLPKDNVGLDKIAAHFDLTKSETNQLKEAVKTVKEKQESEFTAQGKLSWAVKALRAAWDAIPTKVKAAMGGIGGFEIILNTIDNFTGAVEDACYAGALKVTGNPTAAWWITKTLMLFL